MSRSSLILSAYQEATLIACVLGNPEASPISQRARAVLFHIAGFRTAEIARFLSVSREMVSVWLKRFAEGGFEALFPRRMLDCPRSRMDATHMTRLHFEIEPAMLRSAQTVRVWMAVEMNVTCTQVGVQRLLQRTGHALVIRRTRGVGRIGKSSGERDSFARI